MSSHHTPKGLEHEILVPQDPDYHGHPNYLRIYITLIVLFAITVFASLLHNPLIIFLIVFVISVVKASMVLLYFMHLKWEPKLIWLLLGIALMTLTFLFIGLYPDVVPVERYLVPKP
jgi:cytochrome c oxidase subunit 4